MTKLRIALKPSLWLKANLLTRAGSYEWVYRRAGAAQTIFLSRFITKGRGCIQLQPHLSGADLYLAMVTLTSGALESLKHRQMPMVLRLDGLLRDVPGKEGEMRRALRVAYENTAGVIYQSEFAKELHLSAFGLPNAPTKVIFNGAEAAPRAEHPPFGRKRLITIGRNTPPKRLRETIECFRDYRRRDQFELIVVCDDVALPRAYPIPEIRFLHGLTPNRLNCLIASCDALVHLAIGDACPNVVVEALVSNVPVICVRHGGTPELVADSGIVLDADADLPVDAQLFTDLFPIEFSLVHAAFDRILAGERFRFPRPDLGAEIMVDSYVTFLGEVSLGHKNR